MSRHRRMQFACGLSALLTLTALVALLITTQVGLIPTAHAATNTSQFKGVNWADPRDNYANDPVVPSGLSTSDSYSTTYAKATAIIKGFATNLSANTVRLPINPYSVNGSFWNSYTGAIDAATAQGFKVILGYWEGTGSSKDGLIDNTTSFWAMWQTVTSKYASNSLVYFEPMNEPYSYSLSAWTNILVQWINTYPSIPKSRIISSGTGWNDNVTGVCADSRLAGTYLSLHDYGFNNTSQTSVSGWENDITSRIGSNCFSRTIVDEWGAPMTTNLNYDGAVNGSPYIAFVQAMADVTSQYSMGSVYWPGLRNGDTYSMETLNGSGTSLYLTNNNASGIDQLKKSYGLTGSSPTPTPTTGGGGGGSTGVLRGSGSNRCLDVPGAATANGTLLSIYDCNGGANQQWTLLSNGELQVYGNKCLDVPGGATAAGTKVEIWDCNGGNNQQWTLNSNGTVVGRGSGLCLDVVSAGTANGTAVDIWTCNGGSNQQWTRQ